MLVRPAMKAKHQASSKKRMQLGVLHASLQLIKRAQAKANCMLTACKDKQGTDLLLLLAKSSGAYLSSLWAGFDPKTAGFDQRCLIRNRTRRWRPWMTWPCTHQLSTTSNGMHHRHLLWLTLWLSYSCWFRFIMVKKRGQFFQGLTGPYNSII